ncbi:MAG: histidinol-phosphate aminotransferase [Clostridia bacterium BRH_c25]|nr:MAG: histidinol-phosphate aminotransferase [Clostridia bacterium BRH_c25]
MQVKYRKELDPIPVYVPGKPIDEVKRELGLNRVIKLASNENPFGFSPYVKEALLKAMEEANQYPDGNSTLLKEAIAQKYGISVEMVLPTCGSDEMIDLIAKTFIGKDDEVVMADITFPRYSATSQMMGASIKIVPLRNLTNDIEGIIKAVNENTRVVWLCNPNNPTGTIFSGRKLVELMEAIPPTTLLVYDEAYSEFASHPDYPKDSIKFLNKYKNMLLLKTLSKAYGLAGLRLGYTIGDPELISTINKIRNPFNVTLLSQAAGAAAINDEEFLAKVIANNNEGKEYIYKEFDKMGLEYAKTEANHIIFNAKKDNSTVFNNLLKRGVIIRPVVGFNPNTWLRVSLGTMEENREFIKALKEVLK